MKVWQQVERPLPVAPANPRRTHGEGLPGKPRPSCARRYELVLLLSCKKVLQFVLDLRGHERHDVHRSMLATVTAEWGPTRWAASTMLGGARRDQPARLEQIDDTPSKLGRRSRGRVKHEIWAFWRLVG